MSMGPTCEENHLRGNAKKKLSAEGFDPNGRSWSQPVKEPATPTPTLSRPCLEQDQSHPPREESKSKSSCHPMRKEMVTSPNSLKQETGQPPLEETPKKVSKRKAAATKERVFGSFEYNETLVGSKIKVWWPKDRMFYGGLVDSFDPIEKKHKIVYDDGDEETANLRTEKWEFIADENASGPCETQSGSAGPRASADKSMLITLPRAKEESAILLRVVRQGDKADVCYWLGRNTYLKQLMLDYCRRKGLSLEDVKFLHKDERLVSCYRTADDLEMQNEDRIHVHPVVVCPLVALPKGVQETALLLCVKGLTRDKDVCYWIGRKTPLNEVMLDYCSRKGDCFCDLRFMFDGERLIPQITADDLLMEDGDLIKAIPAFPQ